MGPGALYVSAFVSLTRSGLQACIGGIFTLALITVMAADSPIIVSFTIRFPLGLPLAGCSYPTP